MNWSKYQSAFDIFNNITAKIVTKGNYDDYEGTYTSIELGTVTGNLQAFSGGLAEKDYGLVIECQHKLYCRANNNLKEGNYLIISDTSYKIMYVHKGDIGYEVLLKQEVIEWLM